MAIIDGSPGNDTRFGTINADTINGFGGNDLLSGLEGNDSILGGSGNDTMRGDAGNDILSDSEGVNSFEGGADNDTIRTTHTGLSGLIDGGTGTDLLDLTVATLGVTVTLGGASPSFTAANGTNMTIVSIENVTGGSGADSITGGTAGNVLSGRNGNDSIFGGSGNDFLFGEGGNDSLNGGNDNDNLDGGDNDDTLIDGSGNDTLRGGNGNDTLTEGAGTDTVNGDGGTDLFIVTTDLLDDDRFSGDIGTDTIDWSAANVVSGVFNLNLGTAVAGALSEDMVGFENLIGTVNNDIIFGTAAGNLLNGGAGGDEIIGETGNDTISAGSGTTSLIERLFGGEGADSILGGGSFARTAYDGGKDNDTLVADNNLNGNDDFFGGEGLDTADFSAVSIAGNFNLAGNEVVFTGFTAMELRDVEVLIATAGNDSIKASNGGTEARGGAGLDTLVAGSGNDLLFGDAGNDILITDSGADKLFGGTDNDILRGSRIDNGSALEGGAGIDQLDLSAAVAAFTVNLQANNGVNGADTFGITQTENIFGGSAGDTFTGNTDANILSGNAGNDTLNGGGGTDLLEGGANDDNLNGGEANDTLIGGAGADAQFGDGGNDLFNQGADGVQNTITGGLGTDTLDLTTSNVAWNFIGGTGTSGATVLFVSEIETLISDEFSDSLRESGDLNIIDGAAGADTIAADSTASAADAFSGGGGIDTLDLINLGAGVSLNLATGALTGHGLMTAFENALMGAGGDTVVGSGGANSLDGFQGNDVLQGGGGLDTLTGGDNNDALFGEADSDSLFGGAGNDTLEGGAANDTLNGGTGNDLYVIEAAGDVVSEAGGDGIDTVNTGLASYTLLADFENLTLLGAAVSGIGNAAANIITGTAGNNSLLGDAENDTLNGADGADTLNGGTGNDSMAGGDDDDVYIVDSSSDVLDETGGSGNDSVQASVSYALAADIEILQLTGAAISGTGNGTDNRIIGQTEANQLFGGLGDDTLIGGAGADTLNGGIGIDAADYSGSGSAIVVRLIDGFTDGDAAGDVLSGIENVTGSSSGDSLAGDTEGNLLDGQGGNDLLTGGAGADTLAGGGGVDTASYLDSTLAVTVALATATTGGAALGDVLSGIENVIGGAGADRLSGDGEGNLLDGDRGNDTLDGGLGADSLTGGLGLDTANYSAAVVGLSVNLGTGATGGGAAGDTLSGIENLTGGTANDTLSGDGLVNVLRGNNGSDRLQGNNNNDRLYGGGENDQTFGGAGNDQLFGDAGNDALTGGVGNDSLAGGTGNDRMSGGGGNDRYTVDSATDIVSETVSATNLSDAGGRDRVDSAVSLNLGATPGLRFVEEVFLTGRGNTSATGNALGNLINGNGGANTLSGSGGNDRIAGFSGADILSGGAGRDTLTGGNGADSFVFTAPIAAGQADSITDFSAVADTIRLDDAAFAGLGLGVLSAAAFARNLTGTAGDASDRIIYETDTGRLWFDADGTGAGARVQFATVTVSLPMTNADFLVF